MSNPQRLCLGGRFVERVAIFIDGSNFYHALKRRFGNARIRFDRLAEVLTNRLQGRKLVRVYYYNAAYDQVRDAAAYRNQQRFFDSLRRTPYLSLTLGRLERRSIDDYGDLSSDKRSEIERILGRRLPEHTYVEKGVDVQLVVDMVKFAVADTYDVAILISGDGDFAPAVEFVKQQGKHVELGRVEGWPCNQLRDVCDVEVAIDEELLRDCWFVSDG